MNQGGARERAERALPRAKGRCVRVLQQSGLEELEGLCESFDITGRGLEGRVWDWMRLVVGNNNVGRAIE